MNEFWGELLIVFCQYVLPRGSFFSPIVVVVEAEVVVVPRLPAETEVELRRLAVDYEIG